MSHGSAGIQFVPKAEQYLLDEGQLCKRFGFSQSLAFKATLLLQPPTLPAQHVSRSRLFSEIARRLDTHSTICIVAYPNSGKTITVAEFAHSYPARSLWFSLPPNATASEPWFILLCWRLAQFLELEDIAPQQVGAALAARVVETPILLTIDNAQHAKDLSDLAFLKEIAEASNNRFRVILISADEPAFRAKAHGAGIAVWPCPGLDVAEATALYESLGPPLSAAQLRGLSFLVSMTDGHVGLLRLVHRQVKAIDSDTGLDRFIAARRTGLGPDAESKRVHIVEQFRSGLSEVEFTMCKKLSISLGPFPKRVARAVWVDDRDESSFQVVWNSCVVSAFDITEQDRYALPDLYQQGCREFCTDDERTRWHRVIANELEVPVDGTVDPNDIVDSIAHRVLGNDTSQALTKAAMFLIIVRGKHRKSIREFLARRFDIWLGTMASFDGTDPSARVMWHSVRSQICRDLGWKDKAKASISSIEKVLTIEKVEVDPMSHSLGWGALLAHASETGNVDLAILSSTNLTNEEFQSRESRYREFLLLGAHLVAKRNPLPVLGSLISDANSADNKRAPLWDKQLDFDFWRSVGLALYFSFTRMQPEGTNEQAKELKVAVDVIEKLQECGEYHVAAMVGAAVVRILIDLERDFAGALSLAKELVSGCDVTNRRVEAHLKLTVADAFRCARDLLSAERVYQEALASCPTGCDLDRSEIFSLMAITVSLQGNYVAAANLMRKADAGYSEVSNWKMAVRCRLEAAVMWFRVGSNTRAVRQLILAYPFIELRDATCPEWVILGQIAMLIAGFVEDGKSPVEPPSAGFTLAIDGAIPEAENMKSVGPIVMLARACTTIGLPHRGASYFRSALEQSDPILKVQTAAIALHNAIEIKDLVHAVHLAALATQVGEIPEMKDARRDALDFVYSFLIGPVIFAIINEPDITSGQLETALLSFDNVVPSSEPVNVLRTSLQGISRFLRDGNAAGLEVAYTTAVAANAPIVGRHLTWYWLFRAMWRHSVQQADVMRWLWRYCRLTVVIGGNELEFFASSQRQLSELLNPLAISSGVERFSTVREAVLDPSLDPCTAIKTASKHFAEWCATDFAVSAFLSELRDAIRTSSLLANAIDLFVTRLLGYTLLPDASEHIEKLRSQILGLASVLNDGVQTGNEQLRGSLEATRKLSAIVDVLESGQSSKTVFDALFEWRNEMPQKLRPTPAANFYVWLRHMLTEVNDSQVLKLLWATIGGKHAASLLQNPDVPDSLRRRLGVCHWTAIGHLSHNILSKAVIVVRTQRETALPIRSDIWENSCRAIEQSKVSIKNAVIQLELLEDDSAATSENNTFDHWSACTERAAIRRLTGSVLWKVLGDTSAVAEWLQPAVNDLSQAVLIAKKGKLYEQDATLLIRPAAQGKFLARFIGDAAAEQRIDDLLSDLPIRPEWTELIESEKAAAEADPILSGNDSTERRSIPYDDPVFAQEVAEHMMKSHGLPEDRRPFVIADARKTLFIERVQQEYCRHLQPLQDLMHLQSPKTVYASPTYYAGACSLLKHEMDTLAEDIGTVVESFQREYCDKCQHRSPRKLT